MMTKTATPLKNKDIHKTQTDKTVKSRGRVSLPAPLLDSLDPGSNAPIDKQVYQVLRKSLMSGGIIPGTRLSSRSIASALGVSAMPVREALKRLDADGILTSSARSSFVVNLLSIAEYREILKIRLSLEGVAIREASKYITNEEIVQAEWIQERINTSQNYSQTLSYNYKFHFLLYRACRMPYAVSLIENIWLRIGPALHQVFQNKPTLETYVHHTPLIKAMKRRDADTAEAELRADLISAADEYEMAAQNIEL